MSSTLLHFPPQSMQNRPAAPPFEDLRRHRARNGAVEGCGGNGERRGRAGSPRAGGGSIRRRALPQEVPAPCTGGAGTGDAYRSCPQKLPAAVVLLPDGAGWPLNAEDPPGRVFGSGPRQEQAPGGEKSGGAGSGGKRTDRSGVGSAGPGGPEQSEFPRSRRGGVRPNVLPSWT